MTKKIIVFMLLIALVLSSLTTAFAAPLDLFNPVRSNKYSFNKFVDSPSAFDDVIKNLDNFLIEDDMGNYFRIVEIQSKLSAGADNFAEAIKDLEPVELEGPSPGDEEKSLYIVQNGDFYNHQSPSIQEAFDNYFDYPNWEYFYSNNTHIVEFNGFTYMNGKLGVVSIQFTVNLIKKSFSINYCKFGNEIMNNVEFENLLDEIYD